MGGWEGGRGRERERAGEGGRGREREEGEGEGEGEGGGWCYSGEDRLHIDHRKLAPTYRRCESRCLWREAAALSEQVSSSDSWSLRIRRLRCLAVSSRTHGSQPLAVRRTASSLGDVVCGSPRFSSSTLMFGDILAVVATRTPGRVPAGAVGSLAVRAAAPALLSPASPLVPAVVPLAGEPAGGTIPSGLALVPWPPPM